MYNVYDYDYYDYDGSPYKTVCESLELEAKTWRHHSNISQKMENPSVVMIPAGGFIIQGDNDYYADGSDSMWFLPTGSTSWEEGPTLPTQISVKRHCAVPVGDDSFLIISGRYESSAGNLIVVFDIGKTDGIDCGEIKYCKNGPCLC